MLLWTAAAALSTSLPSRADAFLSRPLSGLVLPSRAPTPITCSSQTRLYFSKKDEGILEKMAKTVLPSKWFQSEEERKAALAKQEVKDNVSGGIQEILKDAPLPVRMMGKMISPILSKVASDLSESMAEQQQQLETILDDSRLFMLGDDVAVQALGEPIQVGAPFSQSSSTTIINGEKSVSISIGFPVEGSRSSGMAQAQANQNGITRLVLEVDGRQINVGLSRRGSPSGRVGKNHRTMSSMNKDDDTIIEAEIIEKDSAK